MLNKSGLGRFSIRLAPAAGSYATDPRWSNRDIDPAPVALRTWGIGSFASYWVSDMLAPPLWSTISTCMSLGFSAREVIPITFFGFFICGIVVALNGRIAAIYHIPFCIIARSSFGPWGSMFMIFIRSTVAMMWTSISVVQAGGYLENMIVAMSPSFANWNHLPASSGLTSASILCICLYWGIQTSVSMLHISKLRWFFFFKAVIVPPAWFAMFLWAVVITKGKGVFVDGPETVQGNRGFAAMEALNVIIGLFSSLAVNMPDFARFAKTEKASFSQALLLPIIGTLGALSPIFVTQAYYLQHGSYQWFLPVVIGAFDSRVAKFLAGFAFLVATLGNQIAAGSYPFGNDISGIFPRYVNIRRAAVIISVFCLVSCPWLILANAIALLSFLSGYSIFMGPMAGIMVCDFYLVARQKLSIPDLYNPHGIYEYYRGWNLRAYAAFFIPVAPLLPGLAKSIEPTVNVPQGLLNLYSFGWLFSITTSAFIYYILSVYAFPVTFRLLDEGIYPPSTEEKEREHEERNGVITEGGSDRSINDDDKKLSDAEMA